MANSFEFVQQRPTIQNAIDQAHGLGLDNIAFDTFVDVGDRATIWRTLFSDGILTFESDYMCPFKHIVAQIEPQQDLRGQDAPYPPGGGKNKLPFPYYETSKTASGITFTVGSDGSVKVSGTSTAVISLELMHLATNNYSEMILSGSPSGSSATDAAIAVQYWNGGSFSSSAFETGSGLTLAQSDQIIMFVRVASGVTVNKTFYPMIRASGTDETFAPYSNECPISGWTGAVVQGAGVNVWDEEVESGYINADGSYGTNANSLRSKNFCPCVGGKTYYFVKPSTYTTTPNICWYDSEQNFISRSATSEFPAIPAPSNAKYFKISMWAYGATYNHDISINYPSTDTSYHAYSGDSLSINWQDSAGTVHGGNLAIDEDGSCKLTVDRAIVDMGTLTWTGYSATLHRAYAIVSDMKNTSGGSELPNAKCSKLKLLTANAFDADTTKDYTFCINNTNHIVWARIISATSANDYKTFLSGTQLCYELATPITYTLPDVTMLSTFLGTNNIWASAGGIAVTYKDVNPLFLTDPLNVGVMTLK